MATTPNLYHPDYSVPPGWILDEHIEVLGISHAEFARRCGRSPKLISEIISGKAPLEPKTALEFEKVLGLDARIWLGIESNYRLYRARETENKIASKRDRWAESFPVRELVGRGHMQKPESTADAVSELLAFFGVGSIDAWITRYAIVNVAYRHSQSFSSDEKALATWLRLGELEAENQKCKEYSEPRFRDATRQIRSLTRIPIEESIPHVIRLCNQAGVALTLVEPLPRTALSGAARWLSPRKAVIQLSARHKSDDHLWFSFYHEAAHIILHSKKDIFVDANGNGETDIEEEANKWASKTLIPKAEWDRLVAMPRYTRRVIEIFAEEQEIAPGIVVGMLQHKKLLPWRTRLNHLKVRLEWENAE